MFFAELFFITYIFLVAIFNVERFMPPSKFVNAAHRLMPFAFFAASLIGLLAFVTAFPHDSVPGDETPGIGIGLMIILIIIYFMWSSLSVVLPRYTNLNYNLKIKE